MKSMPYQAFEVVESPVYSRLGGLAPKKKALVRTDTSETLAIVSKNYEIITHEEVMTRVREVTTTLEPLYGSMKEDMYLDKGGVTMSYIATFKNSSHKLKVGDEIGLRVIAKNSYDGSSCCSLSIGGIVLACLNGMVRDSRSVGYLRAMHVRKGKESLEQFPNAEFVSKAFEDAVTHWDQFGRVRMTAKEAHEFAESLYCKGVITRKNLNSILDKQVRNAWDLMQGVTYELTHNREKTSESNRNELLAAADSVFSTMIYERA